MLDVNKSIMNVSNLFMNVPVNILVVHGVNVLKWIVDELMVIVNRMTPSLSCAGGILC